MQSGAPQAIPVLNQYLLDVSFENPAAKFARVRGEQPVIDKSVDVAAALRPDGHYNVDLRLLVSVSANGADLFLVEATYRCVCDVTGLAGDDLERRLLIEGGAHMYPAARNLVAGLVGEGGYSPTLTLDPVDFEAVYGQGAARAPL